MDKKDRAEKMHSQSILTLARSALIFLGVGVFGYVFAFFTKIIAARYFGPEQIGSLELVLTVMGIATMICTLGISSSIPKYITQYEIKKKYDLLNGFIRYALFSPAMVGAIVGGVLFIIAPQLASYLNADSTFLVILRIVALTLPIKMIADSISNIFQAKKESFYSVVGHNVIEKIVLLIAVIIASVTAKSITVYAIGIAISTILIAIVNITVYSKKIKFKKAPPRYQIIQWTKFSLPLLFFGVTTFFLAWTDNFVISKFLDSASLGTYAIAFSLANYLTFIPALFLPLFIPIISQMQLNKSAAFLTIYERSSIWAYTAALFFGTVFIFFPKQIITILFGSAYADGSLSLIILTISFVITSYFIFCYSLLILKGKSMFIFVNTAIFATLNLIANILLVTYVSKTITVVALSSACAFVFVKINEFILVNKYYKPKIPIHHLAKVTICAVSSGAVVKLLFLFAFNQSSMPQILRLIIAGLCYGLFFLATLIISKTITEDDKLIIHAVLTKAKFSQKTIDKIAEFVHKLI